MLNRAQHCNISFCIKNIGGIKVIFLGVTSV